MAYFKGVITRVRTRSRSDRRKGTKARYRKGSATYCHLHGQKAHGEGASRERRKAVKGK